jgi:hypothetical protein
VQARQVLNAELAMQLAAASHSLDWLVHLDLDELFHTEADSVKPHFQWLAQQNVGHMTYVNHEGVPEKETVRDYFRAR